MTVKTGQTWSGLVVCKDSTGALASPSVGPAGALYVDGTVNVASVTISGSNPYKWTVTLPSLTAGQCVSMYITATIATIATASVVAEDVADTVRLSDVPAVNVTELLGTALTETSAGYLAAGFKKLFDVEVPRLTVASYNLTSDAAATLSRLFSMLDALPSGVPDEDYYRWNAASLELVIGADSDTLETLSDQLDGLPTDQNVRDAMMLAPTAGAPAAGSVDKHLDDILEDTGTTLPAMLSGAGSTAYSDTVTDDSSNPLDGVEVWITSDSGGASTVASTTTNSLGTFTVYLDAGTYYLWLAKGGYNFPNPTTITVS